MPLEDPQRPWTHVALDFLTDLPESEEKTTSLVEIDRFSRYLKPILLPALPTAMETSELIFSHVFAISDYQRTLLVIGDHSLYPTCGEVLWRNWELL